MLIHHLQDHRVRELLQGDIAASQNRAGHTDQDKAELPIRSEAGSDVSQRYGHEMQGAVEQASTTHVGHVRFVYICVTPVVLTPNRCEIPRCHGCACDLFVRICDLCAQATKSL